MKRYAETSLRYLLSTLGIFLVAIGIALSVYANLGINCLNATAYAFNIKYPSLSLGFYNFAFFTLCMLLQMAVLGRRFKAIDLLQLPANFLLSWFINLSMALCAALGLSADTLASQAILLVSSCILTAFGISLEVLSKAWMLPADMTVRAFSIITKGKFSTVKIGVDCSILLISCIVCLIFFGNILGPSQTPIIGWGTLFMAVSIGLCMKLTTPLLQKIPLLKD
ncbi:MAG: YitT family protein [Candidatus Cryptobacteroides sp.]